MGVQIPPWSAFSVDRKIEERGVGTRLQPEREREKVQHTNLNLLRSNPVEVIGVASND